MADSYFNAPNPDRRILRNNTNVTGLSAINKNSEFKVPRIPSRYTTQTLCSNAPPSQNPEPSALQLMKTIGDKLEVIDKLRIIPIDEVKQLSAEYVQKLDSLCMEKIARHLQSNSNPTATIVNDNGSAFHTLLSNAPTFPPSVRSCTCQASTCGSEMGYPSQKESVPKTIPSVLKPIPESNKQVKSLRVIPSEDENESVVSFFKKNQSRSKNTKNSIKKPVTSTTNGASRGRTETSVARQETKKPRATHRRSLSADSHVHEPKNKKSATNKRSKDDSDCTIMAPPRVRKIASAAPQTTKNSRTNYRRSLSAEPQIVEPKVRKPYRRSKENIDVVQSTKKQSLTKENADASEKPKKRSASKEKADLPVQQKKRKSAKNSSKSDDVNITKDSLRESKGTRRVMNSIAEVKENAPNACGYDQTDREFFGDVSAIVGESFQDSPNNMMKNMTKMSSNRNDLPLHFFSPFANTRSVSGVSAISTPLSKTVLKPNFNNRLKKPDTLAELKGARPRPVAKRIVKNDILSLDASEDTGNSDFSDYENSDDES